MDPQRFDSLVRSLAGAQTRRGVIGGIAALAAGLWGTRRAGAQVSQAFCGNVVCASDPGKCKPGCVCCGYPNGNSRCRPAQDCTGPGFVIPPPTTTTTAAPTTTTTTTVAPTTTTFPPTTTTTQAPTTTTTTAAPTTTTTQAPTTTTAAPATTTTTTTAAPPVAQLFRCQCDAGPVDVCRQASCSALEDICDEACVDFDGGTRGSTCELGEACPPATTTTTTQPPTTTTTTSTTTVAPTTTTTTQAPTTTSTTTTTTTVDPCDADPCSSTSCREFCAFCGEHASYCDACTDEPVYYCHVGDCHFHQGFCDTCYLEWGGWTDPLGDTWCDRCASHGAFCATCSSQDKPVEWCNQCTSQPSWCHASQCLDHPFWCDNCTDHPDYCDPSPSSRMSCAATESDFCENCPGVGEPYCQP